MSALPAVSSMTAALVVYLVFGESVYLALGWWAAELFLSIPRDSQHGELAPVIWQESWLPTQRGASSIHQVVSGRIIGLLMGLFAPISAGHPLASTALVVFILVRGVLDEPVASRVSHITRFGFCWLLSTQLLKLDQVLLPSAIALSIWAVSSPRKQQRRQAPEPTSALFVSSLLAFAFGASPGMNPALLTAVTEGGPSWLLGFLESFIEAGIISRTLNGVNTTRGFMGALEPNLAFSGICIAMTIGAAVGIALMPVAGQITEMAAPHAELIGWFAWALISVMALKDIQPPLQLITAGTLLVLKSGCHSLTWRSGLLVPLPLPSS